MYLLAQKISSVIVSVALAVAGFFGYVPLLGETVQPAGLLPYILSGSGITSSASSITITSFTIPQTGTKILDSDLSSTFYLTLEPGSRSRQEFVSCDTVTQNSGGTATFSGCIRGLSPVSPYTASSSLQFSHGGGSSLVLSNPPQLYQQYANRINAQTITGLWNFSSTSLPQLDAYVAPTTTVQFAPKKYVDDTVVAGAPDAAYGTKGLGSLASAAQASSSASTGPTSAQPLLGSNNSSASYNGTSTVVVTQPTGQIAPAFLPTSTPWTLSASTTLSGSPITLTGSTTDIQTRDLRIGGVTMYFPSTLGATGTALTVGNPNGALRWQDVPAGFNFINETVTSGSVSTATVSNIPSKKDLLIVVSITSITTGTLRPALRFNCCGAAEYSYSSLMSSTTESGTQNADRLALAQAADSGGRSQYVIWVDNTSGVNKLVSWTGTSLGSYAGYPLNIRGSGLWASTTPAQITEVNLVANGGAGSPNTVFGSGTRVTVFGK